MNMRASNQLRKIRLLHNQIGALGANQTLTKVYLSGATRQKAHHSLAERQWPYPCNTHHSAYFAARVLEWLLTADLLADGLYWLSSEITNLLHVGCYRLLKIK
jgi:hypothetical protein